jgi:colicin import membrane protein
MSAIVQRERPEQVIAGVMAVVVHALFFAMLVLGVSWQQRSPEPAIAELWSALPPLAKPEPDVKPPAPAPEPPPPPKVEAKPEPRPAPRPEPKPEPKPDIALKDKQEKERQRREAAEKEKVDKTRADQKAREDRERAAALEAEKAKEAEKVRLAKEQQDAMRKLQEQQAAAQNALKVEYIGRIRMKIRRFITLPPDVPAGALAEFEVIVLPGGEILGVKLKRASGHAAYDSAVERAILKAQPLPLPQDPTLAREFRELNLQFRPNE